MKTYYVYILRCADDSYYTGVTNDIERRLAEHNSGTNLGSYTSTRRPVEMVFCHEFNDIREAIAFEKQVKGWSRKKKEAIIVGRWDDLKALAECQNATHYKRNRK
ncbi:GIY-YIG nuclease family protein [Dyadobacter sp. CY261]|uniref:GIY-YIG nuclease family protein n=1 Tax=Dyadobacter sp. CY261 TaxID=2907203 RepID=UPI001F3C7FBD|nr:GIY-YIG nuclease family protein [Dyadobacter sp. CY261]MCF0074429.1 GIY-YIG nuclease family protein [Dyadobacter sp. CY261]